MADLTAAFRLTSEHRRWYDGELKAVQHVTSWEFADDLPIDGPRVEPAHTATCLARVAMAALFARVVYGDAPLKHNAANADGGQSTRSSASA